MSSRTSVPSWLAAIAALWTVNAHAIEPIDNTPFQPTVYGNSDPEICGRFQSAWRQVYAGKTELRGQWLDIEAAFPGAEVHPFPPEPHPRTGRYHGLHGYAGSIEIDTDGDGEVETLRIEGDEVGWRYLGIHVYAFEDGETPETVGSDPLLEMEAGDVAYIFTYDGDVYATSGPNNWLHPVSLYRVESARSAYQICSVHLRPGKSAFSSTLSSYDTGRMLLRMYGGIRRGCSWAHFGTMGWTGNSMPIAASRILNRPQSVDVYAEWPEDDVTLARVEREFRLMQWGTSDPVSWTIYTRLKSERQVFIDRLAEYYRTQFDLPEDTDFDELAERNYFYLVDMATYSGPIKNLKGKRSIWGRAFPAETVPPHDPPKALLKSAVGTWLEHERDKYSDRLVIWEFAAKAAAYTRQDTELVERLWLGMIRRYEESIAEYAGKGDSTALFAKKLREDARSLFLAALGNPDLRDFARSLDVDVNAGTNWFGKTPLMYAAQSDDLSTLTFLLDEGADPNVKTRADPNRCGELKRDRRTALMYAAENASAETIEALLEAGADGTAQDSEGNAVSWYLSRNDGLGAATRERLLERLGD